MSESIRIRTTPGDESEKYIEVKLEQDFDFLELLSLKIDQEDVYQSFCSEYGIIAGRVIINKGFGVPNTKVSIFVPINSVDINNQKIKDIYPYEAPTPDEKNISGMRYNLLPNTQQTIDHTPVGNFPEKREVLDNKTTFEIYEKYYKFTTTTNISGDFILFGIPVGRHILHYDMDISDIGFLSPRPYELMEQGHSEKDFESRYKFKSSPDLDKLPQIISGNISVNILPYWCDNLSTGSIIGINRQDIEITSIEITPTAIFFGSVFSDDEKDSINKNCRPRRRMGLMKEVITGGGTVEAIRRTTNGTIESYNLSDGEIDDNGNWSCIVPMNMRKVITDEFGQLVPTNDPTAGVATESDIRFKIRMDPAATDKRLRQRASFLVPNMTANYTFETYSKSALKSTNDWKINRQISTFTIGTPYEDDLSNEYNYLEDFYTFRWKKVYTVKQYIGRYQSNKRDETRAFTGIKDIVEGDGTNKFPTNRLDSNIHPIYSIVCFIMNIFGLLVGLLNSIINQVNGLITAICQVKIPCWLEICVKKCAKIPKYKIQLRRRKGYKYCVSSNAFSVQVPVQSGHPCYGQLIGQTWNGSAWVSGNYYYRSTYTAGVGNFMVDWKEHFTCPCTGPQTLAACQAHNDSQKPWGFRRKSGNYPGCISTKPQSWPTIACLRSVSFDIKPQGGPLTDLAFWNGGLITKSSGNCGKPCPTDCPEPPASRIAFLSDTVCFCIAVKILTFCLFTNLFCKKCRSLCPGKSRFSCCDGDWDGTTTCTCSSSDGNLKHGKCADGTSGCIKKCRPINAKCGYDPKNANKPSDNKKAWCAIPKSKRVNNGGTESGYCLPRRCGCGQKGDDVTPDGKDTATLYLGCSNCKCCEACCGKVPLIRLDCDEDSSFEAIAPITIIPTIFAANVCNQTYIIPYSCASCGGLETPLIKDWVACKLENLAGALGMLQFDFYNDWVNGTLYFPLVKRKYKVKKRKKKQGQIKKDKFCDYDCDEFQGQRFYKIYRIKIRNIGPPISIKVPTAEDTFCNVKFRRSFKYITNWHGGRNPDTGVYMTSTEARDAAAKEMVFSGEDTLGGYCQIDFKTYTELDTFVNNYVFLVMKLNDRKVASEHGKPKYVKTEDPNTGLDTWENIGGHSHHKNKCNSVFLHERGEYFKSKLDCNDRNTNTETPQGYVTTLTSNTDVDEIDYESSGDDGDDTVDIDSIYAGFANNANCPRGEWCDVYCLNDGVGACTIFCQGKNSGCQNDNYTKDIRHGVVVWVEGEIYYVSHITQGDVEFNSLEYKANLFWPTDITDLGSATFCDIDEAPFIMDSLVATSFNVSEDQLKYRTKEEYPTTDSTFEDPLAGNNDQSDTAINDGNPYLPVTIKSIKEMRKSKVNVRAYAEFACFMTKCMNIFGTAVQSQIGVDMIDSNDLGIQTRACFLRFEHEDEIRGYFCRRFSGYKNNSLDINYMRPGSLQFENTYKTYNEMKVVDRGDGLEVFYITPEGEYIESLYNDGDAFIPGDRCGITSRNNNGNVTNVDYFYGLAPGQTPNLINFPNGQENISDINAQGVDIIDDEFNGVQKGIKFNRSQTPYYFYFGLIPGKTALHRVVTEFFADKIDGITLQGVASDGTPTGDAPSPPIGEGEKSVNEVFKTCLGELPIIKPMKNPNNKL